MEATALEKLTAAYRSVILQESKAPCNKRVFNQFAADDLQKALADAYGLEVKKRNPNRIPTYDDNHLRAFESSTKWLKESSKNGLVICGGVGTGKTTLAKAVRDILMGGGLYPWKFLPMYELQRLAKYDSAKLDSYIKDCHLILDDIGTEPQDISIYGTRAYLIQDLIYERYDSQRHFTIITTNKSPKDIRGIYGERVASRLNEAFDLVVLSGIDLR